MSAWLAVVVAFGPVGLSRAETEANDAGAGTPAVAQSESLLRYVPAGAGFFVHVPSIRALDEAWRRAHLERLGALVDPRAGEEKTGPFGLREALRLLLGGHTEIDVEELLGTELALAAGSWQKADSGILFVRLPDAEALDRWFPVEERLAPHQNEADGLLLFRTAGRMLVCVRHGIAAIAPRTREAALIRGTMRLMAGDQGEVLGQSRHYEELRARVKGTPLAVAYLSEPGETAPGDSPVLNVWPPFQRAVLAIHERAAGLELEWHSVAPGSVAGTDTSLSRASLECVRRLPRSTVLAWATAVNIREASALTASNGPASGTALLWSLLRALQAGGDGEQRAGRDERTEVVVAWDQDLRPGGSSLQLAVLVQSTQAAVLRDRMVEVARRALQVVRHLDPSAPAEPLQVNRTTYLGTPIVHIPLAGFSSSSPAHSVLSLLAQWEPAFAAQDRWVIAALSPDHVRRILDSRQGLLPRLEDRAEIDWLGALDEPAMLAVAQPVAAAGVLEDWLKTLEGGGSSVLAPALWEKPLGWMRSRQQQLGIGMRTTQTPGVVVVARVYPGTPAAGKLLVDDWIVGVDGRLLDMNAPNESLRRELFESTGRAGPKLRVLRAGRIIDVQLTRSLRQGEPLPSAADIARQLTPGARTIRALSFGYEATDPGHYNGRLVLNLEP
ncbi:MAG TPA: hypothetical protein PKK06_04970 [Phycisphaerae bacterium]|nr:hypothetical protein [Phycisphaerae bacterium]HNU45192.1 hypothetical protein [Phycisphaerae bacterium]